MNNNNDYLIIGSGILGLSIAHAISTRKPEAKILMIDKEDDVARHSSGRNSGVLHAGFYYSADSLKAKLTAAGNRAMRRYCDNRGIAYNPCGKLVVAKNEEELKQLDELKARGDRNGSNVNIIDQAQAEELEPNIKTYKKALYSPDTASVDPKEVCRALKDDLKARGISMLFNAKYIKSEGDGVATTQGFLQAKTLINCAGLYADKIAHDFGLGLKYTMLPFKGLYLKYAKNKTDIKMNIYPVPNLRNPFLGVHFTKDVDQGIKIGPTAIPALWRENYEGLSNIAFKELLSIAFYEAKLFLTNSFGFRDLALEEMRKYNRRYFINLAGAMVKEIDADGFGEFTEPGIRAQLLDKTTSLLVQDFVIESDEKSIHILNAVSPAFTCAFSFAEFVFDNYILKR